MGSCCFGPSRFVGRTWRNFQLVFLSLWFLGTHRNDAGVCQYSDQHTKQFHEITALPNVFLGSLDYPHARQKWIDLEDEKAWEEGKIGINSLEQLTWKQGLDLYSCTECGRCYDVCPTYVTGKPLTQKWVNQSLLRHLREEEGNI